MISTIIKYFGALIFFYTLTTIVFSGQEIHRSDQHDFKLTLVAGGLERPWGLAFLPSGDMLVTERAGRLRIIKNGKLEPEPVIGLPNNIYAAGQGGVDSS